MMSTSRPAANPEPCSLCGGLEFRTVLYARDFDTGGTEFSLAACENCELVRTEPAMDETRLNVWYDRSYYGQGARKFLGWGESWVRFLARHRAKRILSALPTQPGGRTRILDIGCGRGQLLGGFRDLGADCFGIERQEFPDVEEPGITLYRGDVGSTPLAPASIDVVILWHTLEHLESPAQTVAYARRFLKPGGTLVISVPNFSSWQRRLFGSRWFHLDLPRHRHHFGMATLRRLVESEGFVLIRHSTFSLEQNLYGFVQSLSNAMMPRASTNRLYQLLKGSGLSLNPLERAMYLLSGLLLVPLGAVELVLSHLAGRGAAITLVARRDDRGCGSELVSDEQERLS